MRVCSCCLVASLMVPLMSIACDRSAAGVVQSNLRGLAQVSEAQGRLAVNWGPVWDTQSDEGRLRLIRTAANADACLAGVAREIRFYANGRMVGVASPKGGVRLFK